MNIRLPPRLTPGALCFRSLRELLVGALTSGDTALRITPENFDDLSLSLRVLYL